MKQNKVKNSSTYRIEKKLVSSQVEHEMMQYLMRECHVGDRIPNEFQLAERFGTSRSTIREVVKSLAGLGMLKVRQGSGTYVTSTTPVDADPLHLARHKDQYQLTLDMLDVRLMLEPNISAAAAEKASEKDIEELRQLETEIEELIARKENHSQKDIEFHSYIAKCSENYVVQSLMPIIQTAVAALIEITELQLRNETIKTHRMIIEAIARHDPRGASCAMTAHLAANYALIAKMKEERDQAI
ncbi:MAG: FadR family transcriptional regulator [Eubacterium sp.]|nr:FadR family transcriptional regulator [Eubacterium sp.]